ncbi:Uracil DNA glycosylase superfamily protein [Roseimaritima multifibrata]|uniref:Type-4 uracil-DNA glycosylase n=1 Tax=Roseimaritima multifibrata TaxID=1930274 RepID=A0A517MEM0_9BACT|nr:uracil-DNA glycosylase [Roseimaritima multifibrata]QDS93286.1 Uracil DNA glycosylase superfamily protein [Roseimaritima multifibrata]
MSKHLSRCGAEWLPRGDAAKGDAWLNEHLAQDLGSTSQAAAPAAPPVSPVAQAPAATQATPAPAATQATPATPAVAQTKPAAAPAPPKAPVIKTPSVPSPYPVSLPLADRENWLTAAAAKVAACVACAELAGTRKHTVFGEGNPDARVCFLSDVPKEEEDRSGRPFVGQPGELLTKMIEACKLRREDVYLMNSLKCRPPGNRHPRQDEIDRCRPYFTAQLDVVQPEYIVCMGLMAAQTLLQTKESVGQLRGRFHVYRTSKVLVTYHPEYLLRTPSAKRLAWEDLQRMMADMGTA